MHKHICKAVFAAIALMVASFAPAFAAEKPNILVIWGDDIGYFNISAYNLGMMGYKTPNIDSLAKEGAVFTDMYAQNSCTAGRSAFALGQQPFRTGLLTIGMPGSPHGIPDWAPTIGDLLKNQGYATGHFGKNHLGDQDKHLPTAHGFDEFFGNLYHLNAEEEPETYYYPKNQEFREKFAPRGVIRSKQDGAIEDTGPLTRKRMESIDYEFGAAANDFMERSVKVGKPFFVWLNYTRTHVWTRQKKEYQGSTGIGIYADAMREMDDMVGDVLAHVKKLGIEDNTIIVFSSDNGAEKFTFPDGGTTPFFGEKGTTWEGGMRVPQLVKWPGTIKPGTVYNDIMSQEDWLPTLLAAAGVDDVKEKLASDEGYQANGKNFRVHLDGYNFKPYFEGKAEEGPRREIMYFAASGLLNAIRVDDWKVAFASEDGPMPKAYRRVGAWPVFTNLRADPFESSQRESDMYVRWMADNMWLMVPAQMVVKNFMGTIKDYPFQAGSSLSVGNIGYGTLSQQDAMKKLNSLLDISVQN